MLYDIDQPSRELACTFFEVFVSNAADPLGVSRERCRRRGTPISMNLMRGLE
jgi:hypothetical protein